MPDESMPAFVSKENQVADSFFAQACVDAAPSQYAALVAQLQQKYLPKLFSVIPLGFAEKGINKAGFGDGFPDIKTLTEILQTYLGPVAAIVAAGITLYLGYEYYEKRYDSPTIGVIIGVILAAVVGILTYEFASDPVGSIAKIDLVIRQLTAVLQQMKTMIA